VERRLLAGLLELSIMLAAFAIFFYKKDTTRNSVQDPAASCEAQTQDVPGTSLAPSPMTKDDFIGAMDYRSPWTLPCAAIRTRVVDLCMTLSISSK